jgi:ABC-2 type transport system ATP-binding protein
MEIGEQIIYLARLKGLSREEARRRIKFWFEKLEMETWWNKKVEELSKGMQQKAQFVATVIHNPELLILDEPFSGFDPVNADLIKDEILELNQKGTTILFSTHRMESVEELCDSIALINKSRKILDGKMKDVRNSYRNNTFLIEYTGNKIDFTGNEPFELLDEIAADDAYTLKVQFKEGVTVNEVLQYLIPQAQIHMLQEVIPSMHEIFIQKVNQIDGR